MRVVLLVERAFGSIEVSMMILGAGEVGPSGGSLHVGAGLIIRRSVSARSGILLALQTAY
jgi:hypothetical protein